MRMMIEVHNWARLTTPPRCPLRRHKSILSDQALASFGIKPDAPIATFVKRQGWKAPALTTPGPSFASAAAIG